MTQQATPSAMLNIYAQKPTLKFANLLAAILIVSMGWMAAARAADCPRPGRLGTSRVLAVDAATTPRVGLKSFPQTLPLDDHEVVLTFDDGPWPATTSLVLAALARECVHATFFLIGRSASEHPDLVRRIAAEGHTIGHHTWKHPSLKRMTLSAATEEIDRGIAADEMALHGVATRIPSTPFFRFPGFESTPAPQLKLPTDRLTAAGKGIILLHDPKTRTAAMLPAFLRYLADHHYRVVHLVPAVHDYVPATPGAAVSRAR